LGPELERRARADPAFLTTTAGKYSDGRPLEQPKVWLGDAKVDPEQDYTPVYDRRGRRTEPPKEDKPADKPAEQPESGKDE
jgi:hypothetical protein